MFSRNLKDDKLPQNTISNGDKTTIDCQASGHFPRTWTYNNINVLLYLTNLMKGSTPPIIRTQRRETVRKLAK